MLRGGMEVVVLALAVLTPWAFGGVDPVFELAIAAGIALLLALWAAVAITSGRFTVVRCPVSLMLTLIVAVGVLQLVPLPAGLLGWISPGAADLRDQLYPAQPEQLTPSETAPGPPTWPTVSVYPHATRAEVFRWLAILILFTAVRNQIATTASLWRLSLVMLVNGCLIALFGLVQFYSNRHQVYWSFPTRGHAFGPFLNRNHFAAYVNLCIALGAGLLVWLGPSELDRKRRYMVKPNAPMEQGSELASIFSPLAVLHSPPQLWTLVGMVLMAAAVICSLSRAGVLTLLLGLLITTCLRLSWPLRLRRLEVLIVPALLLIGLFAWMGFRPLESRFGATLRGAESIGEDRLHLWAGLLRLVPRFPILGAGYGTLGYVEPLTRQPDTFADPTMFVDHAHNDYLEALVEGGIVRAGLTILVVGLIFAAGFRGLRRYAGRTPSALAVGAMAGFLMIALHSAVDFSITTPAVGILAAAIAGQLVSVARSDPTKAPAAARGRVVSVRLGSWTRAVLAVGTLALGSVLVLHAWQADRAHRYRLTAFRAAHSKAADLDQAVTYLEAAARLMPDDADVHADLGQVYLDVGQGERDRLLDRLRYWDQVAALIAAGDAQSLAVRLAVLREVPRPDRARLRGDLRQDVFNDAVLPGLRHMVAARRLCPLLPRPHMRFAAHTAELTRADPPGKYWERALILASYDPDLWFYAGVQRLQDGRAEEAWTAWRKSLELTPKPKYDWQRQKYTDRLSAIASAVGRQAGSDPRRRADVLLKHVLPDRPDDLVAAARLLDPQLSATGPSRPLLDRALVLLSDRPEGLPPEDAYLKAQVHATLGDDEAAVRAYKYALSYASAKPEWRYQLVKLLMAKGRWKEALAELPALKKQMPDVRQVQDWIDEASREALIQ